MILIDDAGHMVSDASLSELHSFAARIGLARRRFHGFNRGHPHYDVRANLRGRALAYGAREVETRKDLVRRMIHA